MDIVQKAKEFATKAHKDHFAHFNNNRKFPYVMHLEEVADLVKNAGGNDKEIAAAWLHDTIEDTETTIEDIEKEFGQDIAEMVFGLTDLPEFKKLPLEERKKKQAERVAKESNSIKKVKLADQTSNVRRMSEGKPDWTKEQHIIYINGAKDIAKVCKEVSPELYEIFETYFKESEVKINNMLS